MRTHMLADLDVSLVAYCTSQAARRRKDDQRTHCGAASDGECFADGCPQVRDCEPARSGRNCPLPDYPQEGDPGWPHAVTIEHLPSALHRDVVTGYVEQPGWLPSTEERIDETGEHPVANDKAPGRHAAPWTADRALADALDGLDGVGWLAPRHRDRTFFAGPVPLSREARTLAQWTVTELTA